MEEDKKQSSTSQGGAIPKRGSPGHMTHDHVTDGKAVRSGSEVSQSHQTSGQPDKQEEDLEACMRASEQELEHVTRSVHRSFTASGSLTPQPPTPRSSASMPRLSTGGATIESRSSSGRSSGVMEQLMAEMEQVFHGVLRAEDELKGVRRSMTTTSEASSSCATDDPGLTSSLDETQPQAPGRTTLRLLRQPTTSSDPLRATSESPGLDSQTPSTSDIQDQISDTPERTSVLNELTLDIQERTSDTQENSHHPVEADVMVQPGTSKESVPLAEIDDFSESNGPSSDDGHQSYSWDNNRLSNSMYDEDGSHEAPTSQDGDVSSPISGSTTSKMGTRKRKWKSKSGKRVMNGPLNSSSSEQHVVDMNGNGTSKYRRWLSRIESYDDLDKTFTDSESEDSSSQTDYDMLEFAEKYYNVHYIHSGYSAAITKTVNIVRRKSLSESVPLQDLLKFTKNSTIPTSHVHLLNTEDVTLACSIFKDLCKYVKGEMKGECSTSVIRSVVAHGQQRIELRDEIYCQLVRLTNANPSQESTLRAWGAMCLCSVAFSPSRTLRKYMMSYTRQFCDAGFQPVGEGSPSRTSTMSSQISRHADYCLHHFRHHMTRPRNKVPSFAEVEAVFNQQPLVFRIYFLDGTMKSIAVDATAATQEALNVIQEKIGLVNTHGWSLYESTPSQDRYIRPGEYLSDILAEWEEKQRHHSSQGTPKKGSPCLQAQNYGKLIMCKRLCQRVADIPEDPVELHLLYAQAVHYVVHLDDYVMPLHTALHLAGLQAVVEYGEYEEDKLYRYQEEEVFLSQRVLCSEHRDWTRDIATAHKRFGKNKSATEAEVKYLTIVSQFQLYGCTKVFAHYRGVWSYGSETVLAVNYDGIKGISVQEKTLVFDFLYGDIEQIILEERYEECHVILLLKNSLSQSKQKCYMFECLGLEDFASLIEFYSPEHATWTTCKKNWRRKKIKPPSDWLKMYDDILICRRTLMQKNVMNKPSMASGNIFKTALNKLSGRNCGSSSRQEDHHRDGLTSFWSFTRTPFKTALTKCASHELEDVSARMFNSTLVYTGLESAAVLEDMDLVVVVQTLITKCMENDDLCNEFYLQLIKQTTDTQAELNQRAIHRYWHLMTMATCVMLPPNELVFTYVNLHLRRYAMQDTTEEGQFAYFCIKSLYRTYENKGRKCPPSYKEIHFVSNRQPIEARVHLADGHAMLVEFDSATTANEMMHTIKAKAGMRLDSEGYGVYQTIGERELYIKPDEKLADALYNWERSCRSDNPIAKDLNLIFKKRLFIEPFVNLHDPIEVDLLYNQSVTDVFEQKIPLTKSDATALCALRAQFECGDYGHANSIDYSAVMRILPRHLRDLLLVDEISLVHQTFHGMSHILANIAFLDLLKHWPLYGATMFDVTQTSVETLPRVLWLAVSQMGLHLMEVRGPDIFFTYTFDEISSCSPTNKNLTIMVGKESSGPGFLFYTPEAEQIVQLITDYREVLTHRTRRKPQLEKSAHALDDSDSVNIDSLTIDLSS